VRSLPDGIAKALEEYLIQKSTHSEQETQVAIPSEQLPIPNLSQDNYRIGELCPECGQATFINEEGCRKCYTCGYSEC